jgi:tight adherence protein C
MLQVLPYAALIFMVFCVVALLLAPNLFRPSIEATRIFEIAKSTRMDVRTIGSRELLRDKVMHLGSNLRARLGLADNPQLKARMLAAGIRRGRGMEIFFASQFATPIVAAIGASFIPSNTVFWMFACGMLGYLIPDIWLTQKTKRRRNRIRRSLPDAIDLMVICVDAGLGLDQALLRVGVELAVSHPEINEEFTQVNLEQRAGRPRLEAWQSLADRTKIEEFAAFTNMLTQTDRFGTPIIRALSRFSEEIRSKRRQRAEEAAAKTKIKIIFPLVLCIFPCIFIVLLAPAILSIASGLESVGQ